MKFPEKRTNYSKVKLLMIIEPKTDKIFGHSFELCILSLRTMITYITMYFIDLSIFTNNL